MSLKFRVETRFQAVEPGVHGRFQAGEPCFQAGKASADEIHLQNSRYDATIMANVGTRIAKYTRTSIMLWLHYTGCFYIAPVRDRG
jgi:hypothetical protein